MNISRNIIEQLISDKFTFCDSDTEKENMISSTISRLKEEGLCTVPIEQFDVSSKALNLNQAQIYTDLLMAYENLEMMNSNVLNGTVKNEIEIIDIISTLNLIKDELESCKLMLSEKNLPNYRIERFRNANALCMDRFFQKERYGGYLPKRAYVNYNKEESCITLPLIRQDNSLKYDNIVSTAYVGKNFQLGEGYINNNNFSDVENIIDCNDSTTWNETILSDAPFKVSFPKKNSNDKVLSCDNYYYDVVSGAVCELAINYESVNTVNEINLYPYVKYPIRIISIRYKLTDDEDEELKEIVCPENKEPLLRDVFIDSKHTFRFPDILCKNIYIAFVQEHYERNTYNYNPLDVYKNELWLNSVEDRKNNNDLVFKPLYEKNNANPLKQYINAKIVDNSNTNFANVILPQKTKKVVKYEYQYGFNSINCFNNHYDRSGVYISNKINANSNIKTIQIDTVEEHQKDAASRNVSDIEYYITSAEEPNAEDWIPILPVGRDEILSELLIINGSQRAYLRFEAEEVISILKNGEPLTKEHYYHCHINERTGKIWCIQVFNYDFDAVYSVRYKPVVNSDIVDLSDKVISSVETFESNDMSMIELSNIPCIDKDNSIQIRLSDTKDTTSNSFYCENITKEEDRATSYTEFDNKTNKTQFYCYGNKIFFNKVIPKGVIIDISYKHYSNSFRIKAYLRRTTNTDGWLTPVLKEIKYNIDTF